MGIFSRLKPAQQKTPQQKTSQKGLPKKQISKQQIPQQKSAPQLQATFRRYKSASSNYQQPLNNPEKPYDGWRRNTQQGYEELVQARYVSYKQALEIISLYKQNRKKAIKQLFDKNRPLDYTAIDGVILFTKKDKQLYHSSLIERIEPGLNNQPVQQKEKASTDKLIENWIKEDKD